MLNNELIEEIIYISSKGQVLDKKTILKIALQLLNTLDDYTVSQFNGIVFEEQSKFDKYSYASLNKKSGKIKIFLDEINRKNFNTVLEKNLMIVESLIHEFKHLEEANKISKRDFEAVLLAASNNNVIYESLLKNKHIEKVLPDFIKDIVFLNYYYRIYNIIPAERIAEIESFDEILNSISNYPKFKLDFKEDYEFLKNKMIDSYFRGYKLEGKKYNIPLVEYFKKIDNSDILNVLGLDNINETYFIKNAKKQFSLEERFKFGLPIDENDKRKIIKKKLVYRNN